MLDETMIERRLVALEREIAELRRQLAQPADNWTHQLIGPVTDDDAFRKIIEFGREFRNADRPPDEPDDAS